MAIEDWINWDCDGDDFYQEEPFKCPCKWCGKNITMTPTDDGWRPMFRGKLHICEERKAAQAKAKLDLMPDLSLPECQFCGKNMVWRKETDYETSWSPHFFLSCECGATGPHIERGHPDYEEISKTIK